uniref:Protein kinase domain-containing protein n=1 Tax=Quercus lobata TaxID=97700 RepID=A0A7N2N5U3_QUELO
MISIAPTMRNLSKLTHIVSVFCLFFLLYHITLASSTPTRYVPVEDITLDCGSATSGKSKDMYGRDWTGDFQSKFFPKEELNLKSNNSQASEGIATLAPYTTARISYSQFTYIFPVTVGPKFVRLHFYPSFYSGFEGSIAFFTVKAGSFTLLRNFTASAIYADSFQKQIVKEFCINVEENQKLNLTFIPFSTTSMNFYAFINGIEIVSLPKDLYYSREDRSDEKVPVYVGQGPLFYINYNMALEKVFRLNVGGSLVSPTEDTGFFRVWNPDVNYFNSSGAIPHNSTFIPKYLKIINYAAPDGVYQSARTMDPFRNTQSNMTWGVPVDSGFNYLVRLHFCEIDRDVRYVGERRFTIYIDYQLAEESADVLLWTDENKYMPFYKDYVVMVRKKGLDGEKQHILSIDLHPMSDSTFQDAILNGIEVFKLSNRDGSLTKPDLELGVNSPKSKRYVSYYPLSRCWCLCWLRHNTYRGKQTGKNTSSLRKEQWHHFSLADIKIATNNLHEDLIIGKGGFGNVYKGQIDDEETMTVAIKRLNPESQQGAHEFRTEIEMLSQLRYVHLVSLIGYCNENGEMIIVYDYMTNGTLREHLYDTNNDTLPWKKRLDICIGAARGLDYLHRVSTMVKGTWGYLDPEYARCQKLSDKSDVYSFGVVLLEIAESCTRDQGIQRPTMGDVMEKLKLALELQENADAEKESINTGGEHIYLDTLSFCIDVTNDGL